MWLFPARPEGRKAQWPPLTRAGTARRAGPGADLELLIDTVPAGVVVFDIIDDQADPMNNPVHTARHGA